MARPRYNDIYRYIDALCEAYDNPSFEPDGTYTYCNMAVRFVAEQMGYHDFGRILANDMVDKMIEDEDWYQVTMHESQNMANQGYLTVAGLKSRPHGHVAIVRPGRGLYSPKWQAHAPRIMNVGQTNFIAKGANWAFAEVPYFFFWNPEIETAFAGTQHIDSETLIRSLDVV